jgi:multidrug resistance efflux pump
MQWRLSTGLLAAIVILAGGVSAGVLVGVVPNPFASPTTEVAAKHSSPAGDSTTMLVKAVHPKRSDAAPISVEHLATVEPYYRADLRARAAGIVRKVHRDIGDTVQRGDVLVEIDVSEWEQEVAQLKAVVKQREQELKVSEAKLKDAKAALDVSIATIKQREAEVAAVTATRDLKKGKLARYKQLAGRGTVVGSLVEEEERDYASSEAAVLAAKANVERAIADKKESESKVEAAAADIQLKRAQIEVAQKDVDGAQVVADYGRVLAPFDGVVVQRKVDPGSFVQNATSGASETLISIARIDIVTVTANFTDSAAPLIRDDIPAEVRIDDLAGATISAKVTRFSPSIQSSDRSMRVEVDLFNGSDEEYARLVRAYESGDPDRPRKGAKSEVPTRAFASRSEGDPRLLPGMTGTMVLSVGGFGESYLLPSNAVYSRSGATYILLVEDDITRQVPVRVQVSDGNTARVAMVVKQKGSDGSSREVLKDLTGKEIVVVARQLEVGGGQKVRVGLSTL